MSDEIDYPQELNPLLGESHRETMDRVGAVLEFVSRSVEIQIESNTANFRQDEFSGDELYGLMLICRTLSKTLEYEPSESLSVTGLS